MSTNKINLHIYAKLVLLYDDTEYPIPSVEFAPYAGPKKIKTDRSKLLVEAKTIYDKWHYTLDTTGIIKQTLNDKKKKKKSMKRKLQEGIDYDEVAPSLKAKLVPTWKYKAKTKLMARSDDVEVLIKLIHTIFIQRGYKPLYVPLYSSELNPIELFWKVSKDRIRRSELVDAETLSSRVIEGIEDVPVEHRQNFIQHSIDVFPKCLNKEPL
ncbi:hypothetical protein G6F43_008094 [Rhizopus delemar]|nr:hypothetical protein G6F43_008094 [Rhizopus delemar]